MLHCFISTLCIISAYECLGCVCPTLWTGVVTVAHTAPHLYHAACQALVDILHTTYNIIMMIIIVIIIMIMIIIRIIITIIYSTLPTKS